MGSLPGQALPQAARYQPLVWVVVAVCAGIVGDRYFSLGLAGALSLAASGWGCWLLAWRRGHPRLAAVLILASAATTAGAWHHCRWRLFPRDELGRCASHISQPVCVEAVALTSPRLRPAPPPSAMSTIPKGDESTLLISVARLRRGTAWEERSGRVRLTVQGHLLGVGAGDRLEIYGRLFAPSPPGNPGEFDFAAFGRSQRELCRLYASYPECVSVVDRPKAWQVRGWLDAVRDRGSLLIWKYVDHQRAALAAAVLLGAREQVDGQQVEEFLATGTVHLLAISGLHVGILVWGLWWLKRLGLMSRRGALILAILFVVLYALVTDARPPVVRAAVLISVMCFARFVGREALGLNTLALAGLLVLAANPAHLFQVGVHLSFLAVATLGCLSPLRRWFEGTSDPLDRLLAQSRPWPVRLLRRVGLAVWGMWLSTAAVWLVALPLVMYRFHVLAPISVVLNPLIWPPMAAALFSGFGVLIFGWLVPPLASPCGWLCDRSLAAIELAVAWGLEVPGGHCWTAAPPLWWVICFYAAVGLGLIFPRLRPPPRWITAGGCVWFAVGFACIVGPAARRSHQEPDQLVCTFASVGHGTSVLVELPGGQTLLYDAGQLGSEGYGGRVISSVLWSRGIRHLDALIVSHADVDHFNAIPHLLERFSVGVVYVSPVMLHSESAATRALCRAIEAHRVPIRQMYGGDRLRVAGPAQLEVLHPPRQGVSGSDNANSIVLRVGYAGRTILLPGDLESPGLEDVMAQLPVDCDVVMAPHHGSHRSEPEGFAAWSTPQWTVISGGHGGVEEVEQAYGRDDAVVLHTAEDGAVRVAVTPTRLDVHTWHAGKWRPVRGPPSR